MNMKLKARLYEILRNSNEFLQDGEKLTLEKDGVRITLFSEGEELSIYEENLGVSATSELKS